MSLKKLILVITIFMFPVTLCNSFPSEISDGKVLQLLGKQFLSSFLVHSRNMVSRAY